MSKEESIRVYLRIRPPPTADQSRLLATSTKGSSSQTKGNGTGPSGSSTATLCTYNVEHDFQKSILHLHTAQRSSEETNGTTSGASPSTAGPSSSFVDDVVNNTVVDFKYRFQRVFEPRSTQEEVFNIVAKDCVRSVLDGFNSTIFAYGQTGSGKTYSITGGTESYADRGVIPRAMAMIYEEVARRRDGAVTGDATQYSIAMSYLQIYNDKGQDLLNHGRDARSIDDLPSVTVHELEEEVVLRNLEQHSAPTLSDALNLLFLGDMNRLYCETPMNKSSSRSHCIFTIYLEARSATSSTVRRSKLNLVDLAGSERVSKTGVSGTILTEAKHINLSLHYLEQVITALSERAKGTRDHIPYRNSFLTMVLRDSVGQNCKTAMLATAHVVASQVAETLSTCQFAQRVAMIRQAPHVNVEVDPLLLVRKLKAEVAQLKDEVAFLRQRCGSSGGEGAASDRELTEDEKAVCQGIVNDYLQQEQLGSANDVGATKLSGFDGDLARIYYCFAFMRDLIRRKGGGATARQSSNGSLFTGDVVPQQRDEELNSRREEEVAALQRSLQQKENEINTMLGVLRRSGGAATPGSRYNGSTQTMLEAVLSGGAMSSSSSGMQMSPSVQLVEDQQLYADAVQLIAELRYRSAGPGNPNTAAGIGTAPLSSTISPAQATLQHVTTMAQEGHLTDAEAAAVTLFFEQRRQHQEQLNSSTTGAEPATVTAVLTDEQLLQDRTAAFETFKASYQSHEKVEETKASLRIKYDVCKDTARQLNSCVDSMKQLKLRIQRRRAERAADGVEEVDDEEAQWLEELRATKEHYNQLADQLRGQKEDIEGMHAFMKRAQEQLTRDFEKWFTTRQAQVQQAVKQQQLEEAAASSAGRVRDGVMAALQHGHDGEPNPRLEERRHLSSTTSSALLSQEVLDATAAPRIATRPVPSPPVLTHSDQPHQQLRSVSPSSSMQMAVVVPTTDFDASVRGGRNDSGSLLSQVDDTTTSVQGPLVSFPSYQPVAVSVAGLPNDTTDRSVGIATGAWMTETNGGGTGSSVGALAPSLQHPTLSSGLPNCSTSPSLPSSGIWLNKVGASHSSVSSVVSNFPPLKKSSSVGQASLVSANHHLVPLASSSRNGASAPVLTTTSILTSPPPVTSIPLASTFSTLPVASAANPFYPQMKSTGNPAADEQLANLYKAREAMRHSL